VALHIGYEVQPPASVPTGTLVAALPPDRYLLKVSVKPGAGPTKRRLLAVISPNMLRQTMGEGGPDGDFAAYLPDDTQVFMVAIHVGGPLYVSQFDDGVAPGIAAVTAYPIVGLLDPLERPSHTQDLPDLASWAASKGVDVSADGNAVHVNGDDSADGYQLTSPSIRAREHDKITVRTPINVERGKVCAGVLNGTALSWLVPPDIPRDELQFNIDTTQAFHVVLANCNAKPGSEKSRFVLWRGTYLNDPAEFYADRLVMAALHRDASKPPEPARLGLRTLPAGLSVTEAEIEGPIESFAPTDLSYRADLVQRDASGVWIAKGRAEGKFTYLLHTKARPLEKNSRVLVGGHIDQGGITVGLLRNNEWAAQVNITDPGDFTVIIAPPNGGTYSILVANDLPEGLDTSIVLTKFGRLPK
jgi:hypothetical protein